MLPGLNGAVRFVDKLLLQFSQLGTDGRLVCLLGDQELFDLGQGGFIGDFQAYFRLGLDIGFQFFADINGLLRGGLPCLLKCSRGTFFYVRFFQEGQRFFVERCDLCAGFLIQILG